MICSRPRSRLAGLLICLGLTAHAAAALEPVPMPDLEGFEAAVRERLTTAHEALMSALEDPDTSAEERSRLYGQTGKIFHAHHAFRVAATCYRNAAELDREDPQWPYILGFLHQDAGEFEPAAERYLSVLAMAPEHTMASLRLGEVYLELNELDRARSLLEKVMDQPGLGATTHAGLGKIAAAMQDHEAAASHYEVALELQPDASRLRVPLGLSYRSLGQIAKAREQLAQRGEGKVRLDDPMLREIGSLTASSEMFLTTAAQALKAGRYEVAERAYRGAIAANPDNPRAHVNLAEVLTRRGALEEAEASAREALRLDPDSFFALFNLANIFERRGQLEEAMDYFERALGKNPASVRANFRLGGLFMRSGDYERAAESYRRVIEAAPSFVHARYLQALALISQGRRGAARQVLEAALQVEPGHEEMRAALARLLATAESITPEVSGRAVELAQELYRSRSSPENLETLAMSLAAAGRFEAAVSAQLAVIEAARDQEADPQILQHLEHNLKRYERRLPSDRPWHTNDQTAERRAAQARDGD